MAEFNKGHTSPADQDDSPGLEQIYCVPGEEAKYIRANVVVAGGGISSMEFLELVKEYGLLGDLINLVGIYDPDEDAPAIRRAGVEKIYTTTDYEKLFKRDRVDLVMDFSGSRAIEKTLREETPEGVSVMDHFSTFFLWNMVRQQDEWIRKEKREAHTIRLETLTEMTLYLADEMRNPLMTIGGFANSILKAEGVDPKVASRAEVIVKEAKRLEGVISDILGFVRPLPLKKDIDNINRIIKSLIEKYRDSIDAKDVSLQMQLDDEIPDCLLDSHQMEKVVACLVSNSLEAMDEGGLLTVHTELCWDDFLIAVRDTGHGMDRTTLEKIMNPFFSTKRQRAGIGLAMCRKIVEDHGGQISVFSEKGEGTLVKVVIPLAF